ncbi:MAG TPA: hypothetical protein VFF73_21855, partial [Planctomycetota bacterium]|nr:hypothetical protein [Planctomycetota bacterium]
MSKRSRIFLIAFLVLLAAELVGAGFAGWAAWRARRPLRRLKVSFGDDGVFQRPARFLDGPDVRFLDPGRLALAVVVTPEQRLEDYGCEVWSVETATLERRLETYPDRLEPRSARGLVWSGWARPLEIMDLVLGTREPLPWARGKILTFVPGGEIGAELVAPDTIEFRDLRDGSLVRKVALPAGADRANLVGLRPRLVFSPQGDRLVFQDNSLDLWICELANAKWWEAGVRTPIGFTPAGLLALDTDIRNSAPAVIVKQDGTKRPFVPGVVFDRTAFALSGSGERFAYVRRISEKAGFEVVV